MGHTIPLTAPARYGHIGHVMGKVYVSTSELAEALGTSPKAVRRAADTGRIPRPSRGENEGSWRRWTVLVAAGIVRDAGRPVPMAWVEGAAASAAA